MYHVHDLRKSLQHHFIKLHLPITTAPYNNAFPLPFPKANQKHHQWKLLLKGVAVA